MRTMRTVAALAALSAASAQQRSDHFHTDANGEIADLLNEINKAREVVGSCPLEWDETLASAAAMQDNIVRCEGNPIWDTQDKDGLLVQSAYLRGDPVTPAKWLDYPISHKSEWDMETTTPTVAKREWYRWTSIVWKDVTKMGCHSCHFVNEFYNDFITFCKFDAVTNVDNQFGTQIGNDGDVCRTCSTVDCSHLEDQCVDATCDPTTITCVTSNKPDTTACVDSSPNILPGTSFCSSGVCQGQTLCTGVTCQPETDCMFAGTCDITTGMCTQLEKPDTTACVDSSPNILPGTSFCSSGVCQGQTLCTGVTCQPETDCFFAGTCDVTTGLCKQSEKANGVPCDDGFDSTVGDVCRYGVCGGTCTLEAGVTVNDVELPGTLVDAATSVGIGASGVIPAPVSDFLVGSTYHSFEGQQNDVLKLSCPPCATNGCRYYIAVYHCPPVSSDLNGGMTASLPSMGWEVRSCGPEFYPNGLVADKLEKTLIFRKDLAAGETAADITLDRSSPFTGVYTSTLPNANDWCQPGAHQPKGPVQPRVCTQIVP